MFEFHYQGRVGSLERAVHLCNLLGWEINIVEDGGKWIIFTGEKKLFSADSRENVDSFLYGMALAYSAFPQEYIEKFRENHQP